MKMLKNLLKTNLYKIIQCIKQEKDYLIFYKSITARLW